jgi:3-oxoacyl-[acyl-carrier protein] reductase
VLPFEAIEVGYSASLQHSLTAEDVQRFAALTGDVNPLHVDPEYARKTAFGKPVVHGMLSASFISTLIGMLLPGPGALWASQTLEFQGPGFVGDTLTIEGVVKQKAVVARLLVLDIAVRNQHGQVLVSGQAKVRMLEPPKERQMATEGAQTILVTGASGGIGNAVARSLGAAGNSVILNYNRDKDSTTEAIREIEAAGGRGIAVRADVANEKEVTRMLSEAREAMGDIQGLVHCAGASNVPIPFDSLDWGEVQGQLDVHVKGAFNCVKAVVPAMVSAKTGAIVFISSIVADGAPPTQQLRYTVAKAALSALGRSLASELGPRGIRVNMVSPGMTQTPMLANYPDKAKMVTKMQTPLRQLAEASDVANAVGFLLSPASRHITGETIRVCGGITMD